MRPQSRKSRLGNGWVTRRQGGCPFSEGLLGARVGPAHPAMLLFNLPCASAPFLRRWGCAAMSAQRQGSSAMTAGFLLSTGAKLCSA